MRLIKSWRWFGEHDEVKLSWLKEMGVEEIVTALHHVPNGEVWPHGEIKKLKDEIQGYGLDWRVVESLPVTEAIKTGTGKREEHIRNYKESIVNLAACGIKTVVYNFMPVLDWARTDLSYQLKNGAISMHFDFPTFVAFDVHVLNRQDASMDYTPEQLQKGLLVYESMTKQEKEQLAHNIIVVTQGFIDGVVDPSIEDYKGEFLKHLSRYRKMDKESLRENLAYFLRQIVPLAEEHGINLAIHPDDPPFPVLGLPRIFSTQEDINWLKEVHQSKNNGIAFCVGSFSARTDNEVVSMLEACADRVHFAHLRNTSVASDGSFFESGHINGRVNMTQIVRLLHKEMNRRKSEGNSDHLIPMRPDHGLLFAAETQPVGNPGYPLFGRLKGLAEISGIEEAILADVANDPI